MKKIGILTFHYAENYGAILQTYALYKIINSFPNCCAEIINYVPKGFDYSFMLDKHYPLWEKRRKKFNKFILEKCGVQTSMIHSVRGNNYDVYIVGSDQVWNMDLPEAAQDYEYFLPNLDEDAVRVAYSASIGMEIERINKDIFHKYLTQFRHISLREKSYVDYISELSGNRCVSTLDPTLLLKRDDYEVLTEKSEMSEKKYILYFWYDFGERELGSIETVNALARKYSLTIKHTFLEENSMERKMLANDGGCILGAGIEEFLEYVKNAELIVTNSYHGAIFSIIFYKPFYIYYPRIRKSRQENLVELLKLQERVLYGYVRPENLDLEMKYDSIDKILAEEKMKSIHYLQNAIDNI